MRWIAQHSIHFCVLMPVRCATSSISTARLSPSQPPPRVKAPSYGVSQAAIDRLLATPPERMAWSFYSTNGDFKFGHLLGAALAWPISSIPL